MTPTLAQSGEAMRTDRERLSDWRNVMVFCLRQIPAGQNDGSQPSDGMLAKGCAKSIRGTMETEILRGSRACRNAELSKDASERLLQIWIAAGIIQTCQFFGNDPLAGEEQGVRHLSKREPQRESRSRKKCGSVQLFCDDSGEFRIRNGTWRDCIHGPSQRFILNRMLNYADSVFKRNPAHPLSSQAEPAAHAKPDRKKHSRERATLGVENDPEAQHHCADAHTLGFICGRFPFYAQSRAEILARRASFIEILVAPVSVIADCGCGDEDTRLSFELCDTSDEMPRRFHAAGAENFLAPLSPPALRDGRAGEMNNSVCAFHACKIERTAGRLPADRLA